MFISVPKDLAGSSEDTIGKMPDELTSTVVAEVLSISRPIMRKWVQAGKVDAYKVDSHARFRPHDVMDLNQPCAQNREDAFAELRALVAELGEAVKA